MVRRRGKRHLEPWGHDGGLHPSRRGGAAPQDEDQQSGVIPGRATRGPGISRRQHRDSGPAPFGRIPEWRGM